MRFPVSKPCVGSNEIQRVLACLHAGQLTQGPAVADFEDRFASFVGSSHAVACSSGTSALHLALAALGIGPGDEVLVPDITFVATANAVRYCGATPVLVDVSGRSWNIDPLKADQAVTPRTRAIVVVHLYGAPFDVASIDEFASLRQLHVIEDTAEGLGGSLRGESLGTFGVAGTFSFYGNKVMTTGEGGMVVTDDEGLYEKLRHLRGQAMTQTRYYHDAVGFNYRMTELQAAFGIGQLDNLESMLEKRRLIVDRYRTRLHDIGYVQPIGTHERHAPWLFTFLIKNAERLGQRLAAHGIETRPLFVPLHRMPMDRRSDTLFPVASWMTGLSLPTYPELKLSEVDEICNAVRKEI